METETTAIVEGEKRNIILWWETEGHEVLGVSAYDPETDEELPLDPGEEDRLYDMACQLTLDRLTDMAETYADMER